MNVRHTLTACTMPHQQHRRRPITSPITSPIPRLITGPMPCGPVHTVSAAFADPQVRHLGIAAPTTHPDAGDISIIRNATQIDGVPNDIRRPAPRKAQHTREVLAQFGLSSEEIAALSASDAVA